MSLRRTALTRRSELRRTPMPPRKVRLNARAGRTIRRQKSNTGPTVSQRNLVAERANYCCELCGQSLYIQGDGWTTAHSFHHRRPRGMGGTTRTDANSPANLLLVCGTGTTGCHGEIEKHRTLALSMGWLVRQDQDPATVPTVVENSGSPTEPWVLLTDDGDYLAVAP